MVGFRKTGDISQRFLLVYWPFFSWLYMFSRFWLLSKHTFNVSKRFCLFIACPLAGCACFWAFDCSLSTPLAFPCIFACILSVLQLVLNIFALWLLSKHSFSDSQRLWLFIGRPMAGRACFLTFVCSIITALVFVCIFCLFIGCPLVGCACSRAFSRSISICTFLCFTVQ